MTNFNGFKSPNFTQVPNEYLDYTFSPECDLSKIQMQIMNFVFRETYGWQDKHKILVFSVTDIMALLNVKNRNQVVSALNGLVDKKKFLESIEVSKLSKRVRSNIEKSLGRTLQPKQKIYRLNLIEGKNRAWDNVEEPRTDLHKRKEQFKDSIKNDTSIENDMTSGIKNDTTAHIKNDTTLEVKSLEALRVEPTLNKGLNKDLNKKEEEEEMVSPSDLVSFLISKGITLKNALKFEARLLEKRIEGFTYEQALQAIEWALEKFLKGQCDEPYLYAVGRLERVLDGKVKEIAQKRKRKGNQKKPIRTEKLPDWLNDDAEAQFMDQIRSKTLAELMLMTTELEGNDQQLGWLWDRIRIVESRENRTLTVEEAKAEIKGRKEEQKREIEEMLKKLSA